MSKIFLSSSKDTSIYEREVNLNTGFDEILEVGKSQNFVEVTNGAVRSLIYFNLNDLQGAPTNSVAFLDLKIANASDLKQDEFVYVYPVSRSWSEGSGYYHQSPYFSQDGATWRRHSTDSFWDVSGSDFNLTPVISASVGDMDSDKLLINVTDIIQPMISGSILSDNFGLLLKFKDSSESDNSNTGNIRFFSRNTHTVHVPRLILSWENQSFTTGSLIPVSSSICHIEPRSLRNSYRENGVYKIYFSIRDKYPPKNFYATDIFRNKYYLPSGSTYNIVDVGSGTIVLNNDEYSKVDCDEQGAYVLLNTGPLFSGRFYDLTLKVVTDVETFYSDPIRFSVTK